MRMNRYVLGLIATNHPLTACPSTRAIINADVNAILSQMVGIFECIVPAPQNGDMLPGSKAVNTQFSRPNEKMLWKL